MSCFRIQLLFLTVLAAGCATYKPSVHLASALAPHENSKRISGGSDRYQFVKSLHKLNSTEGEILVFVHDLSQDKWKRIVEVSLTNSKLGHSPGTVSVYWDFSKNYRGKEYAPVPLRTGSDGVSGYFIEPDRIEFDADRSVFLLWFTTENISGTTGNPYSTRLEIRKKDLDDAFK